MKFIYKIQNQLHLHHQLLIGCLFNFASRHFCVFSLQSTENFPNYSQHTEHWTNRKKYSKLYSNFNLLFFRFFLCHSQLMKKMKLCFPFVTTQNHFQHFVKQRDFPRMKSNECIEVSSHNVRRDSFVKILLKIFIHNFFLLEVNFIDFTFSFSYDVEMRLKLSCITCWDFKWDCKFNSKRIFNSIFFARLYFFSILQTLHDVI